MSDGLVVARDGSRFGRIDAQGQLWSEDGVSLGYLGPVVRGPGEPYVRAPTSVRTACVMPSTLR
jgi:hypothetical protein